MAMPPAARVAPLAAAAGSPLRTLLAAHADPDLRRAYAERAFRPIWSDGAQLRPAAFELLAALRDARRDGLDPDGYGLDGLTKRLSAAEGGDPHALADAEVALSAALVAWAHDLRTPAPSAAMRYADPAVMPRAASARAILAEMGAAPTPEAALARLRRMNPLYEGFRSALEAARARGDASEADLLRANLERARALPAELGDRYVLVDVAAQRLEVWDRGQRIDSMPVVVGKPSQPTPSLAGAIRFLVLRPYWHMPPDLAAERVAPEVVREGVAALDRRGLEAVTSFSPGAEAVDPAALDWAAIARGEAQVRLRQRPGPANTMGQVKFIFPNRLGVYLHDTPERFWFAAERRAASSGCVRVSDAARLARLLMARDIDLAAPGAPETRVDLPAPVPVYLVYFTARPTERGVERRRDLYGRDRQLTADLARSGSA